jgi:hypothetical protein
LCDSFCRTIGDNGLVVTAYSTDTIVDGCDFGACTGAAYYVGGSQVAIVGCIGWGSEVGLSIDSSAQLVWVAGCRFDFSNQMGVWVLGDQVTITGCLIYDNSFASSGTDPGILVDTTATNTVISGCRVVGGLNGGTQHSYGIELKAGRAGPATITGCDLSGNGTGAILFNNYAGDHIVNCLGFNPRGALGPPAVPATTVAYTNPYGVDCTVYIAGGTVTQVAVGGTATGLIAGTFRVGANQTITLTYTVAPTWTWFGD